ncbi:AMP-binding protein [uncultured Shewanella sp.]|uniref:AMP-binding protein n=1 Tax=uncultured Shewanella sp. TaxID=173975 RepID=UPI00261745B6|nr:AMP-binding protein [uncultured Shewanella sp.]
MKSSRHDFLQHMLSTMGSSNDLLYLVGSDGSDSARLSREELNQYAMTIAYELTCQCHLKAGDRVLLIYPPSLDFVEALLGCLYAGIIPVPVIPPDPMHIEMEYLNKIIADCSPKLLLTSNSYNLARKVGNVKAIFQPGKLNNAIVPWLVPSRHIKRSFDPFNVECGEIALLQYTSGSTSDPKGVCITWGNLNHQMYINRQALGFNGQSRIVSWVPHFHDFGLISGILNCIYGNGCLWIISPLDFIKRPALWMDVMDRVRATHTAAPDFAYKLVARKTLPVQREQWNLSYLQIFMSAAEPIRDETIRYFIECFSVSGVRPEAFCPAYGLAEHTVAVSIGGTLRIHLDKRSLLKGLVKTVTDKSTHTQTLVGCGQVPDSVHLAIVNADSGERCHSKMVGEIWVDSASKAKGYWGMLEGSEQVFNASIKNEVTDHQYLRTGDLGFMYKGELFITGRLKDTMIINGENIYPQDIELAVEKSHSLIRPGCVIAFSIISAKANEAVVIALEVNNAKEIKNCQTEVIKAIEHSIYAEHPMPILSICILNKKQLPKTTSGKVQRQRCKQSYENGDLIKESLYVWNNPRLSDRKPSSFGVACRVGENIEDGHIRRRQLESSENRTSTLLFPTAIEISIWLQFTLRDMLSCRVADIDVDAHFSCYSLSSVLRIQLFKKLENWLNCDISPVLMNEYPSVSKLARYLAKGLMVEQSKLNQLSNASLNQNNVPVQEETNKQVSDLVVSSTTNLTEQDPLLDIMVTKTDIPQEKGVNSMVTVPHQGGFFTQQPSSLVVIRDEIALWVTDACEAEVDNINYSDDFFSYGFDSIQIIELSESLSRWADVEINLEVLREHSNINEIAKYIYHNKNQIQCGAKGIVRCASEESKLVSHQQDFWLLLIEEDKIDDEHLRFAVKFSENIDLGLLKGAVKHVIQQNLILRTCFQKIAGKYYQVVLENMHVSVDEVHMFVEINYLETMEYLSDLAIDMQLNISNPYTGPLLSLKLIKTTNKHSIILLVMHHLISDGTSMYITMRDIKSAYSILQNQAKLIVERGKLQYVDYAEWSKKTHKEINMREYREFWIDFLQGSSELELPYQEQSQLDHKAINTDKISINARLYHALQSCVEVNNCTLFHLFLLGFYKFSVRQTGTNDLCIPIGNANRIGGAIRDTIGFFARRVIIRLCLNNKVSLFEQLQSVKSIVHDANKYSMSYDFIHEFLKEVSHCGKGSMIFNFMVNQHQNHYFDVMGADMKDVFVLPNTSDFKIMWFISLNNEKGIDIICNYKVRYYSSKIIKQYLNEYVDALSDLFTKNDNL